MKVRNRYGYCLYTRHRNAETFFERSGKCDHSFYRRCCRSFRGRSSAGSGSSDRKSGLHSAGSYTPLCMVTLRDSVGPLMCLIVWSIAAVGILIKACWITCPKWFSSIIYIGMGWVCLMGFPEILNALSPAAFGWLLAGGIIYTVGGIIYALKLPIFNSRHKNFGSHEIFHLFVMAGSLCHYIVMYSFVAA